MHRASFIWNGFFPSWIVSICLYKSLFWKKLASQVLHLKRFFLAWTVAYSYLFFEKTTTWITNLTFKKLLSCMTQYYTLSFGNEKTCITNVSFKGFFQTWTDLHDMCLKNMHYNCYIWILEISDYVFVFVLDSDGSHFIPFWKKNLKKRVHNTYCKNKSALMAHCEKYPDQMIRCRSSLRRYVHSGIFAFEVVKYWLVNEKRKCTSATSFEKRRLKNNWPNQHLFF